MYHCKEHGLNCPSNFSFNKKLVLNNKTGKPYGASAVKDNTIIMKVLKPEVKYQLGIQSFNNIRSMLGFNTDNQLKGASNTTNNNICSKTRPLMNIKNMVGLV